MKAMAKYINFTILETGQHKDKHNPWDDSHLIAKKPEKGTVGDLEYKMDKLEKKVNIIMSKLDI